jgi:hypothetical protein
VKNAAKVKIFTLIFFGMMSIAASARIHTEFENRVLENFSDSQILHQENLPQTLELQGENIGAEWELVLDACDPINAVDPLGLDALILAGGNDLHGGTGSTFFNGIAQNNARAYEAANPGKKAFVVAVRNMSDIQKALGATKNIDRLDYVGHGFPGGLNPDDFGKNNLHNNDIANLDKSNFLPRASINLESCNSSTGAENSIAQAFANHFGANTAGITGGLSFGFPTYMGITLLPAHPRGMVDVRHPGQIGGANPIATSPIFMPGH